MILKILTYFVIIYLHESVLCGANQLASSGEAILLLNEDQKCQETSKLKSGVRSVPATVDRMLESEDAGYVVRCFYV